MKNLLLIGLVFCALSLSASAQMKLQIDNSIPSDNLSFVDNEISRGMELNVNNSLLIPASDRLRQIKMMLILNFIAAIGLGDFGKIWSSAFGGNFTFAYVLTSTLMLTASVAYLAWAYKDDIPAGYNYSFSSIPILVGLRYFFLQPMSAFMPYLMLSLGIHLLKDKFEATFGNFHQEQTHSESKFGFNLGAGFLYLLSAAILIDFSVQYMSITADPNSINNIVFLIGLAYALGGR